MNIAVIGGRTRTDKDFVCKTLNAFIKPGDILVSGGAEGIDTIARDYAAVNKLLIVEFLPIGSKYAKGANPYLERNKDIAVLADVVLAFPSRQSSGTWHTIGVAKELGKRIIIFEEGKA
jgi:predicted Rossmann fold nucleotide-binding protein DprA/Smf involved in DNA uptake